MSSKYSMPKDARRSKPTFTRPKLDAVTIAKVQRLQAVLSSTLPPTPVTPGFSLEVDGCSSIEEGTVARASSPEVLDHLCGHDSAGTKLDVPACREVRRPRRLILHSSPMRGMKITVNTKRTPSLYDLAEAAEHHRVISSKRSGELPVKRYRIILKKTVLPRNFNDQINDTLIKSYQVLARAEKYLRSCRGEIGDDQSSNDNGDISDNDGDINGDYDSGNESDIESGNMTSDETIDESF